MTEPVIELVIRLCGWSAIALVFAILLFVAYEGAPMLAEVGLAELFRSGAWRPDSVLQPRFGILALFAGTASVTLLAMALAVPAGFSAAIFIAEFCGPRRREILKIAIELLAAIPSIVWGFVGYMVLNPLLIALTGAPVGLNVLNGGVILALMSVPITTTVAEDALKAVPDSYREAALALGASRWQLVTRVLLPAAKDGLLAAALLGVGRAIGETMAVLMATGHAIAFPRHVLDPVRTLTATIAAELGEAVQGGTHYRALFLLGTLLMLISLAVNASAELVVKGIRTREDR